MTLSAQTSLSASFVAPEVTAPLALEFELLVSDGTLDRVTAAQVTIIDVNRPPVAVVSGQSRSVTVGERVSLDASGSSDPDGDALRFEWTQTGGDAVPLEGAQTALATFVMPKRGAATFKVTVSDEADATSEVELTFSPATGCGCAAGGELGVALSWLLLLRRRRRLTPAASARAS